MCDDCGHAVVHDADVLTELALLQQRVTDALRFMDICMDEVFDYSQAGSERSSLPDIKKFKDALVQHYSARMPTAGAETTVDGNWIWCMLTQQYLPKPAVAGSHVWKRSWHK
jgi:hypothetical protein